MNIEVFERSFLLGFLQSSKPIPASLFVRFPGLQEGRKYPSQAFYSIGQNHRFPSEAILNAYAFYLKKRKLHHLWDSFPAHWSPIRSAR